MKFPNYEGDFCVLNTKCNERFSSVKSYIGAGLYFFERSRSGSKCEGVSEFLLHPYKDIGMTVKENRKIVNLFKPK